MKAFKQFNASEISEAVALLKEYGNRGKLIAGGTDLLGGLKDSIWPKYPEAVINIKTIPGLSYIREDDEGLKIGALTTLTDIAESELVQNKCSALAESARRTASPLLRNLGTIAGNICQENRCWYYRYSHKLGGRIDCVRKGGSECLAAPGDHRYHSIFGHVNKCLAVNPSDTAPALIVLKAKVKTDLRVIEAREFFAADRGPQSTVLEIGEIVTEISFPRPENDYRSSFLKMALRKSIDFAIVNCATFVSLDDSKVVQARICLNGVHNNPYLATEAGNKLLGKPLNSEQIHEAADAAITGARPLPATRYKVKIAKTLVVDTLSSLMYN